MMKAICALALAAIIAPAAATLGVDVSSAYSVSDWRCVVNSGRSFGIVRAWHSYGGFDSNAVATVKNAHAAGVKHVDVYMFPCKRLSAESQVNDMLAALKRDGVSFGMAWFDIEMNPSRGCEWSSNKNTNCAYMRSLVSAAAASGAHWGVYTSPYEWESVMGSGCTAGSNLPLWYAHYDGAASFADWYRIGGWSKPAIKQYSGTGRLCGREVDLNWYP